MKDELSELMSQYRLTLIQLKELELTKTNLRTKMLTLLKANDINEFNDGVYQVKYTMHSRKSLDKEELKEFLISHSRDISEFESESSYEMLKLDEVN
jgi:hypothetical protein